MDLGEFPAGYQCFQVAFQGQILQEMRTIQVTDAISEENKDRKVCLYGCTTALGHIWISSSDQSWHSVGPELIPEPN